MVSKLETAKKLCTTKSLLEDTASVLAFLEIERDSGEEGEYGIFERRPLLSQVQIWEKGTSVIICRSRRV